MKLSLGSRPLMSHFGRTNPMSQFWQNEPISCVLAVLDVVKAERQVKEAQSNHQQTMAELEAKQELYRRNPGNVPFREIERLQERAKDQLGAIDAATASKQGIEEKISSLLPAEKASAEAALQQAQADLDKTIVRAGVDGRVEQFFLRVGDIGQSVDAPGRNPYPARRRPAKP